MKPAQQRSLDIEVRGIMVINNWFVLADGFMKAGWSVRDGKEENTSIELPFLRSQFTADFLEVIVLLWVISV